jgi:hypothetical protein
MFTLGNKEAIANSPLQYPFTPAAATTSANLNIKGFATLVPAKITSASGRRYSAEQLEKISITCPTAANLGIATADTKVPVTVHFRINSTRAASESAIDFIKQGRPLVLELKIDGGSANTVVATALNTALDELRYKYPGTGFPFTNAISSANVILTGSEGIFSFDETVTFIIRGAVLPYTATTTKKFATAITVNDASDIAGETTVVLSAFTDLNVGDTIQFLATPTVDHKITELVTSSLTMTFTPACVATGDAVNGQVIWKTQKAVEAVGSGKELEENTRMSTMFSSDSYAIQPNSVPIIGGKYTQISWSMDVPTIASNWNSHLNQGAVGAAINNQTFTMFFNEDNALASGGQVQLLVTWLEAQANVTFADFKKANGASTPDAAGFIA